MSKFQLLVISVFAIMICLEQIQISELFQRLGKAQSAADMSAARAVEKFERDLFDRQQAAEKRGEQSGKAFSGSVAREMDKLNALAPDYTHGPRLPEQNGGQNVSRP
jgi:hypothetical protein